MTNYPANEAVVFEVETVRTALPTWLVSTVELVELAKMPSVMQEWSILKPKSGPVS